MSERDVQLLLGDILESANKIILFTKGMTFDSFMSDPKTVDAVVRNFEIIGEAANRVPEDFKETNSDVPWRRIIGFRNRIIHEYFGIDYENLWKIVVENIPVLVDKMQMLIHTNT